MWQGLYGEWSSIEHKESESTSNEVVKRRNTVLLHGLRLGAKASVSIAVHPGREDACSRERLLVKGRINVGPSTFNFQISTLTRPVRTLEVCRALKDSELT